MTKREAAKIIGVKCADFTDLRKVHDGAGAETWSVRFRTDIKGFCKYGQEMMFPVYKRGENA